LRQVEKIIRITESFVSEEHFLPKGN